MQRFRPNPSVLASRLNARQGLTLLELLLVVFILSLIRSVQIFDEVYAFTGGGPGTATTFMIQYIYERGFAGAPRLFGLAAAASLLVAGVLVVLTLIQLWITRRNANG